MTNREEVAKKLREAGGYLDKNAPGEVNGAAQSVLFELFEATSVRNSNSYNDAFNRLADLIDPTCHMSCEYGNGDDETDEYLDEIACTPEDTVACHCHTCDTVFRYDRGIIPNYCPSCGARVVRDES